jgi:RNA ligase (TIGR02306 family)
MRRLASVQRIQDVQPIKGADRIAIAQILGWQCVVGKDQFKPGDFCVYFEIDSMIPDALGDFGRLRTRRFRKALSQGLALETKILPEGTTELIEGLDVTEILGVTQYEPLVKLPGIGNRSDPSTLKPFPAMVSKTDELRVQSYPELLQAIQGKAYTITLKYDGSSATYVDVGSGFLACSRNFQRKRADDCIWWKIAAKYKLEELLTGSNYAIQGEIVGPGIQSNRMGLSDHEFRVFTVFDHNEGRRMTQPELEGFCYHRGLLPVETLYAGVDFQYTLSEVLDLAKGNYAGTGHPREGIVVRNLSGLISFKAINNDYLEKVDE